MGSHPGVLAVMSLPRVSLGIIPSNGERQCLAQGSFWIFDERMVQVETMSAGLEVTQPREIGVYLRAFSLLQASAVYGKPAREMIGRAIAELQEG
jgi:hypothetical protein